jgi:hypothetical protein
LALGTYADALVTSDQQARLDEFIQSDLLRVIDEVFDDIDRKSGNPAVVLCMERLEIDLGEISYRDYRQQMPQRLRRQLWQALDNARYSTAARHSTTCPGMRRPPMPICWKPLCCGSSKPVLPAWSNLSAPPRAKTISSPG